jgi:hypothetical protein
MLEDIAVYLLVGSCVVMAVATAVMMVWLTWAMITDGL